MRRKNDWCDVLPSNYDAINFRPAMSNVVLLKRNISYKRTAVHVTNSALADIPAVSATGAESAAATDNGAAAGTEAATDTAAAAGTTSTVVFCTPPLVYLCCLPYTTELPILFAKHH